MMRFWLLSRSLLFRKRHLAITGIITSVSDLKGEATKAPVQPRLFQSRLKGPARALGRMVTVSKEI